MSRRPTPLHWIARACWAAGVAGWLWAFLAQQPVGSTLWVRGLPQAIDRFAVHAWLTGFAVHLLAPAAPRRRALLIATGLGCALSLGALAASAATGLRGVMWSDPRGGAGWVFAARVLGGALLLGALAWSWTVRVEEPEDA